MKKETIEFEKREQNNMIITPAGEIEIFLDGNIIEYSASSAEVTSICGNLDGRYAIRVKFDPDRNAHIISCCIANYFPSEQDGIESGEMLELKSFYTNKSKVSIGMEAGYINKQRINTYDYNVGYLNNGVYYEVLPETQTREYVFGIAWLNTSTDENDVQTWLGADPTLF